MRSDTFSNYRDWRAFLAALQAPVVTYANIATALKAGHDWLTGHATSVAGRGAESCTWLLGEPDLAARKTLGM